MAGGSIGYFVIRQSSANRAVSTRRISSWRKVRESGNLDDLAMSEETNKRFDQISGCAGDAG